MLTGMFWNEWSFFILFSFVHFGCWYEYQKLSSLIDPSFNQKHLLDRIGFPLLGWGFMLFATSGRLELLNMPLDLIGIWIIRASLFLLPAPFLLNKQYSYKHFLRSLLGVVYISLSLALLINLRSGWIWGFANEGNSLDAILALFSGQISVILLIVTIWINDTMAYIVGSFIGKTPLTAWSPKKTWEGTIGGILLSIIVICIFFYFMASITIDLIILVLIAAVSGTIGDLIESKIKRVAGVKDSGSFMPGHGGFLDRFDSIIIAAPCIWLVCYILYR
jgi:phosphatidate cytidylyltransferase